MRFMVLSHLRRSVRCAHLSLDPHWMWQSVIRLPLAVRPGSPETSQVSEPPTILWVAYWHTVCGGTHTF